MTRAQICRPPKPIYIPKYNKICFITVLRTVQIVKKKLRFCQKIVRNKIRNIVTYTVKKIIKKSCSKSSKNAAPSVHLLA